IAGVLGGCWATKPDGTVTPVRSNTSASVEQPVADPATLVGPKQPPMATTSDPTFAARLRASAGQILPPLATGPLTVLDYGAQTVTVHCGTTARRIANQFGQIFIDPARSDVECMKVRDELHCSQATLFVQTPYPEMLVLILRPADHPVLVGAL